MGSIFFIVFFSLCLGFGLAVFATRQKIPGRPTSVPPEDAALKEPENLPPTGLKELKELGKQWSELNRLILKEEMINSPRETFWILECQSGFFYGQYIMGFLHTTEERPYVTLSEVIEFKDFVKSMGGARAHLFTDGYFTRDVYQVLEGPKIALYNRQKVIEALQKPDQTSPPIVL